MIFLDFASLHLLLLDTIPALILLKGVKMTHDTQCNTLESSNNQNAKSKIFAQNLSLSLSRN